MRTLSVGTPAETELSVCRPTGKPSQQTTPKMLQNEHIALQATLFLYWLLTWSYWFLLFFLHFSFVPTWSLNWFDMCLFVVRYYIIEILYSRTGFTGFSSLAFLLYCDVFTGFITGLTGFLTVKHRLHCKTRYPSLCTAAEWYHLYLGIFFPKYGILSAGFCPVNVAKCRIHEKNMRIPSI